MFNQYTDLYASTTSFSIPNACCEAVALSVSVIEMGLLFLYLSSQCHLSLLFPSLLASIALCLKLLPSWVASPVLYIHCYFLRVYILTCSCLYVLYQCVHWYVY